MPTLETRLGDAIESAFKAGNALLDSIISGAGATLNTERTLTHDVEADLGLVGSIQIVGKTPRTLTIGTGAYRKSKRSVFAYEVNFTVDDDIGQDTVTESFYQALMQTLGDSEEFFANHVTDTELNMNVKDGEVEVEPIVLGGTPEEPVYETEVRITCWHKQAMTQ